MSEPDTGGIVCELPGGLGVTFVPMGLPGVDLLDEAVLVWDAPVETLGRQDGEFGFRPRLTHALALIEHAGGQNIRQARLTIRQLLAERDRVLREQVAMRLPPVSSEKLAGTIKSLVAVLDQGSAATSESPWTAAPMGQTEPARPGAAGPA